MESDIQPIQMVIQSLKTGLEYATRYWWILLIPLLLDAFLWLGPRYSIAEWWDVKIAEMSAQIDELAAEAEDESDGETNTTSATDLMRFREQSAELVEMLNVASVMSLPAANIPTLMAGIAPEATPLARETVELTDEVLVSRFGLWMGLGILLSAVYFELIGRIVQNEPNDPDNTDDSDKQDRAKWDRLPYAICRNAIAIGALLIALLIVYLFLLIPVSFSIIAGGLIHPVVSILLAIIGFFALVWVAIYFSFAVPSLILERRGAIQAMLHSFRYVRTHTQIAFPMLFSVLILTNTLGRVLRFADNGTWLTSINLIGHAFIATALLIALFYFYNETAVKKTATTPLEPIDNSILE